MSSCVSFQQNVSYVVVVELRKPNHIMAILYSQSFEYVFQFSVVGN